MFAESLLESSGAQRSQRSWATFTSFGMQCTALAALLMFQLVRTVIIPPLKPLSGPIPMVRLPEHLLDVHVQGAGHSSGAPSTGRAFVEPIQIPNGVDPRPYTQQPYADPGPPTIGNICSGNCSTVGVLDSIAGPSAVVPVAPPVVKRPPRVSVMMEGNLIHRVEPMYPVMAKSARIQGQVVLTAIISKQGTIENLRTVSGHPLLVGAAVDAVKQWRYRPYFLNNEPIEVETQVVVNFVLSRN